MATNTEKIVVQVVVKGGKQLDNLTKKTGAATKSVGGLSKGMLKMAGGVAIAAAAFRAIGQVISSSITTFKNFEFQMAKVKATTGATDKDFKKLTASAQQLGRTTFFTASKVGELQMNFAKLGFTTSEILDAQEATLRLATATGSDLARAAVVAGAAVRGFNLDANETERVVDVMAVAFTSSALDIEKWQTSMTKIAPIAAGANISIETSAAIMGKLSDAGIEASIAGTSLRNIFLKMQDSSSDLSKHLGFSVNSSEDLERALLQLNSEALSNEEIMQLVDLRQVAAFATMVNGTDTIIDMTDALEDANGSAQEMADIMADTLEGDLITAKSAWEGFQLAIMNGTGVIAKTLRESTQIWTHILNRWSDSLKDVDAVSADIFTNTVKAAKEVTKNMNKDFGEGTTTFSKELDSQNNSLKKSLTMKEFYVKNSELKIAKLTKEGQKGVFQFNEEAIADEQKILDKRLKIFNATELAIIDLTEEIEVQKKKEVASAETAALKEFAAGQQEIRNKAKIQREKDKKEAKRLSDIEKGKKDAEKVAQEAFNNEKARIDREARELLNIHKQALINEELTQEVYDEAAFDMEQQRLQEQLDLYIKYEEDTSVINGKILTNELKMIADKADAEAAAAQKKLDDDAKAKKDRDEQIAGIGEIGSQLTTLAGNDEKYQKVREAGIKISAAAALATNAEALALQLKSLSADLALGFPTNIIAVASTLALMMSMKQNIAAIKGGKMARGGMIEEFANGGLVQGKSHAQGGEKFAVGGRVVELEGGEAVINKRSTSMFSSQLSAMNAAGGGVKFADGGLLNQPSFSQQQQPSFSQQQFNALGQNQMMGAMGNSGKVTVVEADITSSQNTVSVIQSQATI
jgi:TP901 family phage tail tape measure protein